jgi:sugar fermentation stimulation protein A
MADVKLDNGPVVTVHCPNSGSMKGCSEPGRTVYLSRSDNPSRRLRYTWEMISMPTSLVGINTSIPNKLVAKSIVCGEIEPLSGYENLYREVHCGSNSRIDLMLERSDGARCFIEIKNCTLVESGCARFPDAVTHRGRKHLLELQQQVNMGNSSAVFFLIQRMDAHMFKPADHIDPDYGRELRRAFKAGVQVLAYDVSITLDHISLRSRLPCRL